jgi:hypothetical protein
VNYRENSVIIMSVWEKFVAETGRFMCVCVLEYGRS